ncbi:hypothetical protein BDK51DRAFT_33247, partial [Blyttiomyces helicus]
MWPRRLIPPALAATCLLQKRHLTSGGSQFSYLLFGRAAEGGQRAREVSDVGRWGSLDFETATIGPFPHGSRELGVDPLSAYGGFEWLPYSDTERYPSELADGGYVGWSKVESNSDGTVGPFDYPNVRWDFNQESFGWTSLHHTTFCRGNITVAHAGVYLASFSGVVSFKLDKLAYVGNIYSYEHSSFSAIWLEEGVHTLFVATVMDVRVLGGSIPPRPRFKGSIFPVDLTGPNRGVLALPYDAIIPEVVDDRFVSQYASVAIMNANMTLNEPQAENNDSFKQHPEGPGWIQIVGAMAQGVDGTK